MGGLISGAKSVFSLRGLGAAAATFALFVVIAIVFNASPSSVAANLKKPKTA